MLLVKSEFYFLVKESVPIFSDYNYWIVSRNHWTLIHKHTYNYKFTCSSLVLFTQWVSSKQMTVSSITTCKTITISSFKILFKKTKRRVCKTTCTSQELRLLSSFVQWNHRTIKTKSNRGLSWGTMKIIFTILVNLAEMMQNRQTLNVTLKALQLVNGKISPKTAHSQYLQHWS